MGLKGNQAILSKKTRPRIFSTGRVLKVGAFSNKKSNRYYSVFNKKGVKSLNVSYWSEKSNIDLSLLKRAASVLDISSDIKDYVFACFDIIGTHSPNSNHMTFVPEQLLGYSSIYGMANWETFKGRPVFVDHLPKDMNPVQSKGIILDTKLVSMKIGKTTYHRIHILKALDRSKDRGIAEGVLNQSINTASMSAFPEYLKCNIHNTPSHQCKCKLWGEMVKVGSQEQLTLAQLVVMNPLFVESSVLTGDNPADRSALSTRKPFLIKEG